MSTDLERDLVLKIITLAYGTFNLDALPMDIRQSCLNRLVEYGAKAPEVPYKPRWCIIPGLKAAFCAGEDGTSHVAVRLGDKLKIRTYIKPGANSTLVVDWRGDDATCLVSNVTLTSPDITWYLVFKAWCPQHVGVFGHTSDNNWFRPSLPNSHGDLHYCVGPDNEWQPLTGLESIKDNVNWFLSGNVWGKDLIPPESQPVLNSNLIGDVCLRLVQSATKALLDQMPLNIPCVYG